MFLVQWFLSMSMTLRSFTYMTTELRIRIVRWKEKRWWIRNQVIRLIVCEYLRDNYWVNLSRLRFILTFIDDRIVCRDWILFLVFLTLLFFVHLYRLIFLHFGRFRNFLFWGTQVSILEFYNRFRKYFNWRLSKVIWKVQVQRLFLIELIVFWRFFGKKEGFYNCLYCIDLNHYFEWSYFTNFSYLFSQIPRVHFFGRLRTWLEEIE